jgi:hypothetical protein
MSVSVIKYNGSIADSATGRPVAGAAVVISNYPSGAAATLYDSAGEVSAAPIISDVNGHYSFYVIPGHYNIQFSSGFVVEQLIDVAIGIGAAGPAGSGFAPLSNYASIATMVAAVGANKKTIAVDVNAALTGNLTIPANIELFPLDGKTITTTGYTLTYNGEVTRWPLSQIFAGTGSVAGLSNARPEWFAATNTAAAFTAAVASLLPGGTLMLSNSTYQTAYGTYAAPMTKSYIKIRGSKMPAFNSGFTGLENGTIIQGGFIIKADYVEVEDFGVDSGSAVCAALYGGTARDGLCWFDTDNVAGGAAWKGAVAHNIIAICKSPTSLVHAVAFEHVTGGDFRNIRTAYGVHGIVFKTTDSNADGLYALSSGWEGMIIKADDYAPCAFNNISNVFLGSIPGHGAEGAGLQLNPNELQPETNINLTNINIYNTVNGFKVVPATGSDIVADINVVNLNVSNSADYGIDIPATGVLKRLSFTNCVANACGKTGWNLLSGGKGLLLNNCRATQNTGSGFYAGAGSDVKLVNCSADDNTVFGFQSASTAATLDGWTGVGNGSGTVDGNWFSSSDVAHRLIMVAPMLLNSWVAYGSPRSTPAFGFSSGSLYLKGTVKNGALNTVICNYPVGRPPEDLVFNVITNTGTGTMEIRANGDMVLTSGGTGYVIYDGIRINQ